MSRRVTTQEFLERKARREKIAMLTAYDHPTAALCDQAGVDAILVGDSLGMVVQGLGSTLPVTLDEMLYHTKMVARAAQHALVVADMPFLSHRLGPEQALRSAGALLAQGGAHAVKLEGGDDEVGGVVRRLVAAGIPVMGHLGLTPQSVHALGGFRVQGRTAEAAARLLLDALRLQAAGAFAIVLELVPWEVSAEISAALRVPTIGIGAGAGCDGQVLVLHDMIGLNEGQGPRHARRYAEVGRAIEEAAAAYCRDVRAQDYPAPEHATALGEGAAEVLEAIGAVAAPAGPEAAESADEQRPYGGSR